jgi:hypothetical protein
MLPLVPLLLWNAMHYLWVDIMLAVLAALAFTGWRIGRQASPAAAQELPPETPESPAKYSNRR